jgi:hypothetical protein
MLAARRRISKKTALACGPAAHQRVDRFPQRLQDAILRP